MDSDFWVSRLAAAKRQFIYHHHNNHLNSQLDDLTVDEFDDEEDDDDLAYPCPYCYVEYDLINLCHHLEDEHNDETDLTVCTICAERISGNMLRHITIEHESLFKVPIQPIQHDRSQKVPIPSRQALSLLGRDLRKAHLQALLAGKGQQSSSGITDPLLSSLVVNYPAPRAEEISRLVTSCAEDMSGKTEPAQHIWQSSFDPSLSSEEREKRIRQAAGKALFMQDLVCSTMLSD